jgi:hypothetical protein
MLGAGVAVVNGKLEEPGAGHKQPVGGERWFSSIRVAALREAQIRCGILEPVQAAIR